MSPDHSPIETIADAREVDIETRSGERLYKTIIWVAASDGELFVRSFRGDTAKWYQRALADPRVALISKGTRVDFEAVPATDEDSVRRASEGFALKYQRGSSLDGMLRADVLHTTLRLDPID